MITALLIEDSPDDHLPGNKARLMLFSQLPSMTCPWLRLIPLTLGWRWRWSDWSFTLWPSGKHYTAILMSHVSTTTTMVPLVTATTTTTTWKLHRLRISRAAEVKHWNCFLLLIIWGIILSNIMQPPECSPKLWGRSDSGYMTKFQHIYASMFLCLFMSVFVMWFVELCSSIVYCPPRLRCCCVSAVIYS